MANSARWSLACSTIAEATQGAVPREPPWREVAWPLWSWLLIACLLATGCGESTNTIGKLDVVWGRRGISDGRLQKPRAMAIDDQDHLYIVDMTARIQVFNPDGDFIRSWQTPVHTNGRPTGISIDRQGRVLVADTHYFRVLIYSQLGEMLEQIGGTEGPGPGEFGWVTDAVQDRQGNMYISEYGEYDRIQKLAPDGTFLLQWGGHGAEPGQFSRPQDLVIDEQDRIWVTDACNHRIQVFDTEGKLLFMWGTAGAAPGELYYPYDLVFDDAGNVYICEYGNHRVQKFTRAGESLGCWGHEGRGPGELHNPWAVVRDSKGRIYVLDTNNHRVQRVLM
ncbi:MAG TPA: NHL repeat-containing protein [Pirellulales bacterium]